MTFLARAVASAALLLALAACGGSDSQPGASGGSPLMKPGDDCRECHGEFTAAGTIFSSRTASADQGVEGVLVEIWDGTNLVTAVTNAAGNFYTTRPFALSASTSVHVQGATSQMSSHLTQAAHRGCASCHGATFRVHVP